MLNDRAGIKSVRRAVRAPRQKSAARDAASSGRKDMSDQPDEEEEELEGDDEPASDRTLVDMDSKIEIKSSEEGER